MGCTVGRSTNDLNLITGKSNNVTSYNSASSEDSEAVPSQNNKLNKLKIND